MTSTINLLTAVCLCCAALPRAQAQTIEGAAADATTLVQRMKRVSGDAKPRIHLYIRQEIMSETPQGLKFWEEQFARVYRDDSFPVKALEIAAGWGDVRDILQRYGRKYSVAQLRFSSHGNERGMAILGNDTLNYLGDVSSVFADNAEVLLESCNVGRGLLGADYGERLGRVLLGRNGGTVRLPRWLSFGGMSDWTRGSPLGYRTVRVLPGGKVSMSDPIDVESERDSLAREIGWMAERMHRGIDLQDKALRAKYKIDAITTSYPSAYLSSFADTEGLRTALSLLKIQRKLLSSGPATLHALAEATADLEHAIWAEKSLPRQTRDMVAEMLRNEDAYLREEHAREIERNGLPPGQFKYDVWGQKVYQ